MDENDTESQRAFLTDDEVEELCGVNDSLEGIELNSTESIYRGAYELGYRNYINSRNATLSDKKWLFMMARVTKIPEVDNIFSSEIGRGNTVLVNPDTGEVCVYNRCLYMHYCKGGQIFLKRKNAKQVPDKVVYDGIKLHAKNRGWLRPSSGSQSKAGDTGIRVVNERRTDGCYEVNLKDQHIIAAMFYGDKVLEAISPSKSHEVHHRNGNHYDNRLVNLQILTTKKHDEYDELLRLHRTGERT